MSDKKYIVVRAGNPDYLGNKVISFIDKGYIPIGGVSYYKDKFGDDQFTQAMTKLIDEYRENL